MNCVAEYVHDVICDRRRGPLAATVGGLLLGASGIYRRVSEGTRARALAHQEKLPVPVVSVGNITWGGTGKTPCVALLIEWMRARGMNPGVLMRGWGADEHVLIGRRYSGVPVICGRDRAAAAREFLQAGRVDAFILDDGFQQWRLHRDCDIVMINCLDPFGNGHVLPRGILRETPAALERADIIMLVHADALTAAAKCALLHTITKCTARRNPLLVEAVHAPATVYRAAVPDVRLAMDELVGKEAVLFSGIGNPRSFTRTVEAAGLTVREHVVFTDHHAYGPNDFVKVKTILSRYPGAILMTTEKDLMRACARISETLNPFVLTIKMELKDSHGEFDRRLAGLLAR